MRDIREDPREDVLQGTALFQYGGIVMESREVIPHDIQVRAANDLGRFMRFVVNGLDDGEPPPVGVRPGHISLTLVRPVCAETQRCQRRLL